MTAYYVEYKKPKHHRYWIWSELCSTELDAHVFVKKLTCSSDKDEYAFRIFKQIDEKEFLK